MENATANAPAASHGQETGWVPSPDHRGTIDIVYGCAMVLISAIWTVIHPNLPAGGDSDGRQLLRRVRWGLVSIFAPDFLTLVSATQWSSAKKSVVRMRQLLGAGVGGAGIADADADRWTMEHAFYADSGGFVLRATARGDDDDVPPFPVNAESMHYLVARGYIGLPDITRAEIWDKSKADAFAKAATLVQVGWIVTASVSRTVRGLPLCPLELFTLAFVVSTAMSYFFWWRKPQHVRTPTVLVCPYSMARIWRDAGIPVAQDGRMRYVGTPMDFVEKPGKKWKRRKVFTRYDLEPGYSGNKTKPRPLSPLGALPETLGEAESKEEKPGATIQTRINDIDVKMPFDRAGTQDSMQPNPSPPSSPIRRIPDDAVLPSQLPLRLIIILFLVSILHSSIHLMGWNFDYPTRIEQQMWRASAVTLASMSCVVVGVVRVLGAVGYRGKQSLLWVWVNSSAYGTRCPLTGNVDTEAARKGQGSATGTTAKASGEGFAFWDYLLSFATALLIISRCYIILEAVLSLRALPAAAFVTVHWNNFIPHV